MSKDELRTAIARGFTAAGWVYAALLTAEETVGYLHSVPWYEKLIPVFLIFVIITPFGTWAYVHFLRGGDGNHEDVGGCSSTPREP